MNKRWVITLMFIIGILIISYPHVAQYVNNKLQQSRVNDFQREITYLPEEEKAQTLEAIKECNESIFENKEGFQDPFTEGYSRDRYNECLAAPEDGSLISSLEIPSMDLSIPIFLGAEEDSLSQGVGQVEGSSLPVGGKSTHTVLAGHRGMGTKEMFRNLDVLQKGDVFYIQTITENIKYTVYDTKVILPHETDTLRIIEGKDLATLMTCHPYRSNSHRLLVYGERVKQ